MNIIKIKYLVIPFLVIIGIFLAIVFLFNLSSNVNGIIINLITDFFVILISITIVSSILNKAEKDEWKEIDHRLASRVKILTNKYVAALRLGFDYSILNLLMDADFTSGESELMHNAVIKFTKEVVLPQFDGRSKGQIKWNLLFNELKNVKNHLDGIFTRFTNKFSPETYAKLLDIEENISSAMTFYEAYPKILEDPEPSQLTESYNIQDKLTKDLKNALELLLDLEESLSSDD